MTDDTGHTRHAGRGDGFPRTPRHRVDVAWSYLLGPRLTLWLGPGTPRAARPLGVVRSDGGRTVLRFHQRSLVGAVEGEDRREAWLEVTAAVEAALMRR